jgi:hypothetical protein
VIVGPAIVSVMRVLGYLRIEALSKWTAYFVLGDKTMLRDPAPIILKTMAWMKFPHIPSIDARTTTLIRWKNVKLF